MQFCKLSLFIFRIIFFVYFIYVNEILRAHLHASIYVILRSNKKWAFLDPIKVNFAKACHIGSNKDL